MTRTLEAVYDGKVFRPETKPDLEPNTRWKITIEDASVQAPAGDVWDTLAALTGTVEAPEDWSEEHDHYLYGTPKRSERGT
jgi:hypothetical protein